MAAQSTMFIVFFRKAIFCGAPASRSRNSTVKYAMQISSIRASFGLSTGLPSTSSTCKQVANVHNVNIFQ